MPPYSTWNPCGTDLFHVESMWNPWIPHGIDMDSIWIPHGIHAESTWTHSTWIPCRFHMESTWNWGLIISEYRQKKTLYSFIYHWYM